MSISWSIGTLETLDNVLVKLHLVAVFFFSFSRDFENLFLREFLTLLASSVWEMSTLIPELRHRAKVLARACHSTQASVALWILAGGLGAIAQNLLPFLEPCSIIRFPVDSLVFLHSQFFFSGTFSFSKSNVPPSTALLQKSYGEEQLILTASTFS